MAGMINDVGSIANVPCVMPTTRGCATISSH
jgi:hypothetical protein